MKKQNQTDVIKDEMLRLIKLGIEDKKVLYEKVHVNLSVPKPTVRRVARDLRNDLEQTLGILSQDMVKPEN